jgi:hypothetical protein
MEPSDAGRRKAEEDTIKMIKPRQHQRRHQGLHNPLWHVPANGTELAQRRRTPGSDDVNESAHTEVWVEVHAEVASCDFVH